MTISLMQNGRVNPAYLKLDLYCRGIKIHPSCRLDADGRAILRTRAGLGSGLEMILPGHLYTNVPAVEKFVESTPYNLHKENGQYLIYHQDKKICPVILPPQPDFYTQRTSSGKLMSQVGVLQGTYLGIYPTEVCAYWKMDPRVNCKFCSVGLNLGDKDAKEKSVSDVVETAIAARRQEKITFVHFNTGYYEGDTYLNDLEPYLTAVKKATGLLMGVQTPPHPDFSRYNRLRKLGVNNVSFCFELWNEKYLKEMCPGKSDHVGLKRYLDAIEYCAKIFDTTNGEIIAGMEPLEDTLAAIDWITSVGAIPTVCVFRPLAGTDYADVPPPKTEDMVAVYRHLYEKCMEHNLPIGMAPNVKVSIVMLPEEGRYLLEDPQKYRFKEWRLKILSKTFAAGFYAGLKLRGKE